MAERLVSFVTTANAQIGTGHLRRCLTLAETLRSHAVETQMFVYHGDPELTDWIQPVVKRVVLSRELSLDNALRLASNGGIVIVDSYDVSTSGLRSLLNAGIKVMVIDDLADRNLPATWLLNSCVDDPQRYAGLTDAMLLLGPSYALLRPQFRQLPGRVIRKDARNVLLTFGGSDVLGLTGRILSLLEKLTSPLHIRVVCGRLTDVASVHSNRNRIEILRDVSNMAEQMMWADMAITAAGQTIFELAASGCPALCMQVADNQRITGELCRHMGSAFVLDARTEGDHEIAVTLNALTVDKKLRQAMSRAGMSVVDGLGAIRVADILL